YDDLSVRLPGKYQMENCRTVLAIVERLVAMNRLHLEESALRYALQHVTWPGRMMIRDARDFNPESNKGPVVIDGAHNLRAVRGVLESIRLLFPDRRLTAIVGFPKNKDAESMLQAIHAAGAILIVTTYASSRARAVGDLADLCRRLHIPAMPASDFRQAVARALTLDCRKQVVLVTGSLYLAGEALAVAGQEELCLNIY
ncbi:MAG TPA: cyanophycin synthetase, partial [bacterium]|nr:cyanophycin synthetase [bacterium]